MGPVGEHSTQQVLGRFLFFLTGLVGTQPANTQTADTAIFIPSGPPTMPLHGRNSRCRTGVERARIHVGAVQAVAAYGVPKQVSSGSEFVTTEPYGDKLVPKAMRFGPEETTVCAASSLSRARTYVDSPVNCALPVRR